MCKKGYLVGSLFNILGNNMKLISFATQSENILFSKEIHVI